MQIRLGTLRKLLAEAVGQFLVESEIYVDVNGWARDDEGNSWYVGAGRPGLGQTYSYSAYQRQFGPVPRDTTRAGRPLKKKLSAEQVAALGRLAEMSPGNNFIASIRSQVKWGLSEKQILAVRNMMKRLGMPEANLF